LAQYLSTIPLASSCWSDLKNAASSRSMNDTAGKPREASKWFDGMAAIVTPLI
jgi:hypothetical protein